jgi:hypothetical protein
MLDPRPILTSKKKAGREICALMVLNGIPIAGQMYEAKDISKGDWITYWDKDLKRRRGQVYKVAPRKGWLRVRLDSMDYLKVKQVLHKEKIEDFQVLTIYDHTDVEDLYDPEAVDNLGRPKLRPAHHVHDGYEQHHVRLKDHSKLKVTA